MPLMVWWTDAVGRVRLRRIEGRVTVGRGAEVDLRLDHPTVAARHAVLDSPDGGRLTVAPLDPVAAIFRNGLLCAPGETTSLSAGDQVGLGAIPLLVCTERPAQAPRRTSSAGVPAPSRSVTGASVPVAGAAAAAVTVTGEDEEEPASPIQQILSRVRSLSPLTFAVWAAVLMVLLAVTPLFLTVRYFMARQKHAAAARAAAGPPPATAPAVPDGVSRAQGGLVDLSVSQWSDPESYPRSPGRSLGFVISETGHVVCNGEMIAGAAQVYISFPNGAQVLSESVNFCSFADLALVKIPKVVGLRPPSLAETSEGTAGKTVLLISTSNGAPGRGTVGQRREIDGKRYVQIDSGALPPAGAPILNERGLVLGVAAGRAGAPVGPGYAVTVEDLRTFLELVGVR